MKNVLIGYTLLFTISAFGQQEFVISEQGLTPRSSTFEIEQMTSSELFSKVLDWVEKNEKEYKLKVQNQTNGEMIEFSSFKGNAVDLDKQYFNAEYNIRVRFDDDAYTFEPMGIRLKLNSKYDMGWNDVDLKDGSMYFKKGKPIRKYKSYLKDLLSRLNELNNGLSSNLKAD